MNWIMSVDGRCLRVALGRGIRDEGWDRLMDGIVRQLSAVDRVTFLVPGGFEAGDQAGLLETLVGILTEQGVDVQRHQIP
jgi:hypothetical protein